MREIACLKCRKLINFISYLTNKICENLDSKYNSAVDLVFIRNFLLLVIDCVRNENEFCFELWIILKDGKMGFVSKTRQ